MRDRSGVATADDFETNRYIRFLHGVNRLVSRVWHHVEVQGEFRVPRRGPAVILSNHISGLDPLLIQSVVNRPIVWMMAKEYYEIAALKWVFDSIRAIPVSRDGKDSTALRAALRTLEHGHLLGIFPEGKIETKRQLLPFQTGAAMIALRGRAPVVPVFQSGTTFGRSMLGAILVPQQVRVRFGPSIDLAGQFGRTRDLAAPTAVLEGAMTTLATAHRGEHL
jgi:1-acyl-sn-glycerol-3-phosphate acyltransferase